MSVLVLKIATVRLRMQIKKVVIVKKLLTKQMMIRLTVKVLMQKMDNKENQEKTGGSAITSVARIGKESKAIISSGQWC